MGSAWRVWWVPLRLRWLVKVSEAIQFEHRPRCDALEASGMSHCPAVFDRGTLPAGSEVAFLRMQAKDDQPVDLCGFQVPNPFKPRTATSTVTSQAATMPTVSPRSTPADSSHGPCFENASPRLRCHQRSSEEIGATAQKSVPNTITPSAVAAMKAGRLGRDVASGVSDGHGSDVAALDTAHS
jgi:hypothetical protein